MIASGRLQTARRSCEVLDIVVVRERIAVENGRTDLRIVRSAMLNAQLTRVSMIGARKTKQRPVVRPAAMTAIAAELAIREDLHEKPAEQK